MSLENNSQAEFWLPPEFLTDDDIITDFKPKPNRVGGGEDSVLRFPECGNFPGSGFSSPMESEESDESEDYLVGLTKKMANSSLLDDLWKYETQKSWGNISVSPQSTLSGFGQGSSRGSPNCLSPPTAAIPDKGEGFELLYAAAGEVARMRMIEEANAAYYQNMGLSLGFGSNQSLSYQQLQILKFQHLRREQLIRQQHALQLAQVQANAIANERQAANLSTINWPTLHQSFQSKSQQKPTTANTVMRAVFLGNNGTKRESAGTGVFIPRRAGAVANEPRKSSGCSTVLLPDRVVQALNLNLEAMGSHNNSFASDFDGAVNKRNNVLMAQQHKMNLRPPVAHTDHRLPQEWTY